MKFSTENIVERITEEEILKRTTEYDIYSYYMPSKFEVGKILSSPFRDDKHPSFGIFKSSKTGSLLFKDQATGESGNCFKFIQILLNISFKESLEKIWSDIIEQKLGISVKGYEIKKYYENKKTVISIKRKNFTKTDDEYWGQYEINRELLNKYEVFPISRYWVNDMIYYHEYTETSPMYAYKVYNTFKVYRPYAESKREKWKCNTSIYDIQGWKQLPDTGDLLVITKSLKDVMVLSLFDIPSIAPNGENTLIPEEAINEAKKRFKRLVLLYDYDDGGMQGVKTMTSKYNLEHIFIPKHYLDLYKVKDISDHIKEFGYDKTKELLNELL